MGTGVKQIVAEAGAPFGSLYHFFPGGKEELGAETIRRSGFLYGLLLGEYAGPDVELVAGDPRLLRRRRRDPARDRLRRRLPDRDRRARGLEHQRAAAPGLRRRLRGLDRRRHRALRRRGHPPRARARARDPDDRRARGRLRPQPRPAQHRAARARRRDGRRRRSRRSCADRPGSAVDAGPERSGPPGGGPDQVLGTSAETATGWDNARPSFARRCPGWIPPGCRTQCGA